MKKWIRWTLGAAAVMVLLPWLAVRFVKGDAGMAAVFVLFFAADPLFCAAAGWAAGKGNRMGVFFPLIPAGLFLAGTWIFFEPGEPAFVRYACIYWILGTAAMALSRMAEKWRKKHG